jgi:TolA-binding protein
MRRSRAAIASAPSLLELWVLGALLLGALVTLQTASVSAAPAPKTDEPAPPPRPTITISSPQGVLLVPPDGAVEDESDSTEGGLPRTYQVLVQRFGKGSPADSMGDGAYRWADAAFTAGKFDLAGTGYVDFARRYPRNLKVSEALTVMFLIKEARDFEDQPLLLYARARALRAAGKNDSAVVALTAVAQRFPGAKVRHHVHLMLAEIARDRGDHAAALRWAVAGADTTGKNRLAPFALQIAAESSMQLGEPPQKALAYYKEILERYPRSPVTPEARARSLEIRKRMPQ